MNSNSIETIRIKYKKYKKKYLELKNKIGGYKDKLNYKKSLYQKCISYVENDILDVSVE